MFDCAKAERKPKEADGDNKRYFLYVCFLFMSSLSEGYVTRRRGLNKKSSNNIYLCIAVLGKDQRRRTAAVTGFFHLPSQRLGST